jgi:hypothetical protein
MRSYPPSGSLNAVPMRPGCGPGNVTVFSRVVSADEAVGLCRCSVRSGGLPSATARRKAMADIIPGGNGSLVERNAAARASVSGAVTATGRCGLVADRIR